MKPLHINLTKIATQGMRDCEILEENLLEPMQKLENLLRIDFLSEDKKTAFYTLRSPLNENGQSHLIKIRLQCLKGSLLTTLWNWHARFDDEYKVIVEELKVAQLKKYFSTIPSIETIPSEAPYLKPLAQKEKVLLQIQGYDHFNKRISHGYCDWQLMQVIQSTAEILSIGLLAFAKLFGRILILLPHIASNGSYGVPMPLSFMITYLFVVETCPMAMKLSHHLLTTIEDPNVKFFLLNKENSAPWIYSYYPFVDSSGKKLLCSLYNVQTSCFPVGYSSDFFQLRRVRLVEIINCPLGKHGTIGVVESVHPRYWQKIVRFVVLNVPSVFDAIRLTSNHDILTTQNKEYCKSLPSIEILDELQWMKLTKRSAAEESGKDKTPWALGRKFFTLVDFRNSTKWGISD